MLTHEILAEMSWHTFDKEMDKISKNATQRETKKIDCKKTKVFDNSNRGRYQNLSIYRERWR